MNINIRKNILNSSLISFNPNQYSRCSQFFSFRNVLRLEDWVTHFNRSEFQQYTSPLQFKDCELKPRAYPSREFIAEIACVPSRDFLPLPLDKMAIQLDSNMEQDALFLCIIRKMRIIWLFTSALTCLKQSSLLKNNSIFFSTDRSSCHLCYVTKHLCKNGKGSVYYIPVHGLNSRFEAR